MQYQATVYWRFRKPFLASKFEPVGDHAGTNASYEFSAHDNVEGFEPEGGRVKIKSYNGEVYYFIPEEVLLRISPAADVNQMHMTYTTAPEVTNDKPEPTKRHRSGLGVFLVVCLILLGITYFLNKGGSNG